MSECRSCRAPIIWAMTERGKRMPLDADPYTGPDPAGLFVFRFDGDGRPYVLAVTPEAAAALGDAVYRSHFASCPDAKRWRR